MPGCFGSKIPDAALANRNGGETFSRSRAGSERRCELSKDRRQREDGGYEMNDDSI